jgi:hypothetical protein
MLQTGSGAVREGAGVTSATSQVWTLKGTGAGCRIRRLHARIYKSTKLG